MKVKVISCEIFRWICEENRNEDYDYTFLEIAQHDHPQKLHDRLQQEINQAQDYDVILLLYGLCGNAICNLKSRFSDLYVFRAHDCSAVLLADNKKQINQRWSCFALVQNKKSCLSMTIEQLQERYGEHAQYLWDILYSDKGSIYIDFNREEDIVAKRQLKERGCLITKEYLGSKEVVQAMLNIEEHTMILKINKDKRIKSVYDLDKIIMYE